MMPPLSYRCVPQKYAVLHAMAPTCLQVSVFFVYNPRLFYLLLRKIARSAIAAVAHRIYDFMRFESLAFSRATVA